MYRTRLRKTLTALQIRNKTLSRRLIQTFSLLILFSLFGLPLLYLRILPVFKAHRIYRTDKQTQIYLMYSLSKVKTLLSSCCLSTDSPRSRSSSGKISRVNSVSLISRTNHPGRMSEARLSTSPCKECRREAFRLRYSLSSFSSRIRRKSAFPAAAFGA